MSRWRHGRGLRRSVVATFALGALLVSTVLAIGTYVSARHSLVEQRERTALRQAYTDAALLRDNLLTSGAQVSEVLGSIAQPPGTTLVVERGERSFSSSLDGAAEEALDTFRDEVAAGSVVVGWSDATTPGAVVVGIPLPAVGATYYEVAVAEELERTLSILGIALAICAALTTIGGAALGRVAARRVLTPLDEVTSAAVRVSSGDLATRLDATDDPDLAALVGSFNHMVDALRIRIEQDARFAADVAHELRTPLTTLTTSLSYVRSTPGLSARAGVALELMADELDRFSRALQDLLQLGRLDADRPDSDPVDVAAVDLVVQALREAGKPETLVECAASDRVRVRVDRPQLLRALTNLVHNADLHGDGLARVRVVDRGAYVDIAVEDEGPGVPEGDRERIFERFARAGGRREGTGSGLGLSIVERAVGNNGGHVWCAAAASGGASFVVRLPVVGGSAR